MSENGNIYHFDDVTVDCENFRVRQNGQNITLTPRAFDVLVFLLRNSGRVIEKQEIFDSVWKDTFVSDNALTKIIKEIRRALDDDASRPRYIETVPKRGYRFIADVKTDRADENVYAGDKVSVAEGSLLRSPPKPKKFLLFGTIVLIVLALAIFAFVKINSNTTENAPIDSIAVLPFENTSGDANLDYLSDGITENLINTLSRLPNLRVPPRSSVFYYKKRGEDPYAIGRALEVRAVLTGKVVQRGETLTIQTELIDVDRKAQIWGQQYNRNLTDVINLQEEISRTIADRLSLRLTGSQAAQLAARDTDNNEAYQFYLKGNYFAGKTNAEAIGKAIEFYKQSIALDPNYALAYAGLSEAYSLSASYRSKTYSHEVNLLAKEAALKALQLNPNLAEANTSLAYILYRYDWNWTEAERWFQRAIELNPNYATAHLRYCEMLTLLERHDEAINEVRRAVELEPLSLAVNRIYATTLIYAGRADEGIAQAQKTIEMDASFWTAHGALGIGYERKGMFAEAVGEYAKAWELGNNQALAQVIREGFARGGWQGYLRAYLEYNLERAKTGYVQAWTFATLYAQLGEKEKALDWLEKSFETREVAITQLKMAQQFKIFRDEPRYRNLLQKLGF